MICSFSQHHFAFFGDHFSSVEQSKVGGGGGGGGTGQPFCSFSQHHFAFSGDHTSFVGEQSKRSCGGGGGRGQPFCSFSQHHFAFFGDHTSFVEQLKRPPFLAALPVTQPAMTQQITETLEGRMSSCRVGTGARTR